MRCCTLKISEYSSIQDAINAIPAGVMNLDLGWNNLGNLSGAELAAAFASIPVSVTSLCLVENDLGQRSGAELAVVFARIPESVTSLYLNGNILGQRSGAELAAAFSSIRGSVTHLDLSWNDLGRLSGADLVAAFASIPMSVTHLYLRSNNLGRLSGAELAAVFASIPAGVTHLDLCHNDLWYMSGVGLADAFSSIRGSVTDLDLTGNQLGRVSGADLEALFASIPGSVTHLDLSDNNLGERSGADLAKLLASIPNTVKEVRLADNYLTSKPEAYLKEAFSGLPKETVISFKGKKIFTPGNREANDALLKKLGKAAAGRSLCFTNTGESDLVRGMSTLVGLSQQVVPIGLNNRALDYTIYTRMPLNVIHHIASFLVSPGQSQDLSTLLESSIMARVMDRETDNSNQKACIVNTLDLIKEGLRRLTVPQLQAFFEEMPRHIRKVIVSDEAVAEMSVDNLSAALRCLHPKMIIKLTTNNETLLAKLLEVAEGLGLKVETGLITPFTMFHTGIVGSNKSLYQDTVCRV